MPGTMQIRGTCESRFSSVKKAFAGNFESGLEVGSSFAATLNGKFVVDIWGGYADAAMTRPWERDTIVNLFSATKIMTALCAWILVDRGLLDLDAPVARYWPEFAQNGKEKVRVRYLLSHTSGLAGFDRHVSLKNLYDWSFVTGVLAAMKPLWDPGDGSGYHGITQGYLVGEVVRRITGKSLGTFFRDEVAVPLGADFHIGTGPEYDSRVAELVPPPIPKPGDPGYAPPDPRSVKGIVAANAHGGGLGVGNEIGWRRAEIPAANGHGNARSMARVGAALACGGSLDGVRLLSTGTIEKAMEEQCRGVDRILDTEIRWGLGVELSTQKRPLGPNKRTFSWGGAGGSMLVVDLDAKTSWAYAMNKGSQGPHFLDPRNRALAAAFYACL
jgi:CubicO group peptidase (beta-lactamase class C family)